MVRALVNLPDSFNVHKKLERQFGRRDKIFHEEKKIDWAFAETLAFGALFAVMGFVTNRLNVSMTGFEGAQAEQALLAGQVDAVRGSLESAFFSQRTNTPLVVVAANELGTINATLQTLIVADTFHDGLRVAGVVLNSPRQLADDPSVESNADELARCCVSTRTTGSNAASSMRTAAATFR